MHGNVSEWCQDLYDGEYYSKSPKENPQGPSSGEGREVRGTAILPAVARPNAVGSVWVPGSSSSVSA